MVRIYKVTSRHSQLVDVDTPHKIFLYVGWPDEFRDANNDTSRHIIMLPKDWKGKHLKLTIHFNGVVDGAGNDIYFVASLGAGTVGEYWDNHAEDSGTSLITAAPASANVTGSFTHTFTGYVVDTDDQITLDLERKGSDALDTYTDSAYCIAMIIEGV